MLQRAERRRWWRRKRRGRGGGDAGGDKKEAEDDEPNTGEGVEQGGGDGGEREAEEEAGEQSSAEESEEEEKPTPLADTPEKLDQWFKSWRENTSAVLPPGFKDASSMEVVEIDDWPPVPVPSPNLGVEVRVDPSLDPNAWRPYLKGCDNSFGELHMKNATYCDKVGGYIVIHVEDLRRLAPLWSAKSEEVRADVEHYTINATGDVHGQRWISEMYGYSFGSSDVSATACRSVWIT
ncbi:unnamed protein product [Closterium sp. Naga37s-1]|nr:unnamed protein product [Closterium sp. Naga37s-1]